MNEEEVKELKAEIERLKRVIVELTAAMKVLTENDARTKTFIDRVETLLKEN